MAKRRADPPSQPRESAWTAAGFGALFAFACWLLHGYTYGINGFHAQFLPHFFKLLDPGLYPSDAYLATLERLPTLFWKGLALVCRGSGAAPEGVFRLVFAAASCATWSAAYLLGRELSGSRRGALAGCVLALFNAYLFGHTPLSQDVFLRTHLDATSFSLPLALFGLLAHFRGRPAAAGLSLGLVLWIQPLYGAAFALCILLAALPALRAPEGRVAALRFGGAFALPALPALFWGLRLSSASIPSADWAELLRLWYPGHYFLRFGWSQGLHLLIQTATLAGLGLAAVRAGRGGGALTFCGAALLAAAGAGALAELWPWRPLVALQLPRMDGPVILLALLSAGALFERVPEDSRLLCSSALGALALCDPLPAAFPQACAAIHLWAWLTGGRWLLLASGATLAGALLLIAGAVPLAHHAATTVPVAVLSALGLVLRRTPAGAGLKSAVAAVLAAGLGFSAVGLRKDDRARLMASLGPHPQFIQQAEMWVRGSTPKDAVVLCFPGAPGLRLGFRRTLVGEWIDGAALNWAADYGPEWKRRMEDHGYLLDRIPLAHKAESSANFPTLSGPSQGVPVLSPWDPGRLSLLIERYRPDIVVAPFGLVVPGLRPEFQSGPHIVYRVVARP